MKSTKSSATQGRKNEKSFDERNLREARECVKRYRLSIEPDDKGNYVGRVLELPGVTADGRTSLDCLKLLLFGAETVVATLLEQGRKPPESATEARRREQINIRLTPEEKSLLSSASERKGFKGVSDFVRNAALRECVKE